MRLGTCMRRIAAVAAFGLAGLVSPPAAAQDEGGADYDHQEWLKTQYRRRGFYLNLAARYQLPTEKGRIEREVEGSLGIVGAASSDVDDSVGVEARLGYRLHPHLAVEGHFEWVSHFEVSSQTTDFGRLKSEQRLAIVGANAKAYVLTGRFQPYVLGGAGWGLSTLELDGTGPRGGLHDEHSNGLVWRAGGGFDLYGSRFVALNVEASYQIGRGALGPLDHLSVGAGLMLRF